MPLLNAQDLESKIAIVGKSAGELQSAIQECAVQAVGYSIEHGDIRFGQKLFDVLPSGVRRQSLVAFLEKHGNFAWSTQDKKFAHYKTKDTFDQALLMETSWASATKESIVSEYDLEDMFTKFMKRVDSAFKQHDSKGVAIKNSAMYDYLVEARDRYNQELYANSEIKEAQAA
jgi:beta-glucosidase/6-phospho-beta-glucosidase/beta-galactosidase